MASTKVAPKNPQNSLHQPFSLTEYLRVRADLFARTRAFFAKREACEVHTPLLGTHPMPEPHIRPIATEAPQHSAPQHWLHTSAEAGMKRLLAQNSGAIYQLCPVFRGDEHGAWHRSEFYMLEWYRPGWDIQKLSRELVELVDSLLGAAPFSELRYKDLWQQTLAINPHNVDTQTLRACATVHGLSTARGEATRVDCAQYLFAHVVEPALKDYKRAFVWDYPLLESTYARERVDAEGCVVAARFEFYARGVELANGSHELGDADVLETRVAATNPDANVDPKLLALMRARQFPDCSGVALGMDRLVAIAMGLSALPETI